MEFGPVPPGLRLGQGHRGSQGQPLSIADIPAVAAGLVVDSHIQQQIPAQLTGAAPMAAYQGLGIAPNSPYLPVPAIAQPVSTTASDHQGSASPSEDLGDVWFNERPEYSLPLSDSGDSQPSNFETGHFGPGAFPDAVRFGAGLTAQEYDNHPYTHGEYS